MRRREFISLVSTAAVGWPLASRAQQPKMPTIGYLNAAREYDDDLATYRQGLSETGYVEAKNVTIDYRWAEGNYQQLPDLVADLVRRQVAVIVTSGSPAAARAAKAATSTIPIVTVVGFDLVAGGLVASLNRPGGNVTGLTNFSVDLVEKRLELLRETLAGVGVIGLLVNPNSPNAELELKVVHEAAQRTGQRLLVLKARSETELDTAFATLSEQRAQGLIVGADGYFASRTNQIVASAARNAISAIYDRRGYVLAGGLISYGVRFWDQYRKLGVYTGRVLNGEKPSDLPVMLPTSFELVINLKTAKALGVQVPHTLQVAADEVIE
jgi:putative tryptophan/tyrosine transport system substrate-binding protein